MEIYLSNLDPLENVSIRDKPGSFVVEEILNRKYFKWIWKNEKKGYYTIIRLRKPWGIDTFKLINNIRKSCELKDGLYVLGLKDKWAVAEQHIIVKPSIANKVISLLSDKNFRYKILGFISPKHLGRDILLGNLFKIQLFGDINIYKLRRFFNSYPVSSLPNFFGYQRFGVERVNHLIGKLLLMAVSKKDNNEINNIIELILERTGSSNVDRFVKLVKKLRNLPRNLIKLYVNAYQSYIFNRVLSMRIKEGYPVDQCVPGDYCTDSILCKKVYVTKSLIRKHPLIPIVGYGFKLKRDRISDNYYISILKEEGISPKDFYFFKNMGIELFGGFRHSNLYSNYVCAKKLHNDSVELDFFLYRGMYATILLRELIKPKSPILAGF